MPTATTATTATTAKSPQPPRRSQPARRAATRLALLEATASCLIERGYAGTTTTVIVERAGLSQGALFKHFPTKAELLATTAAHLYEHLVRRYLDRFDRLDREADPDARLDRAIHLLWQMFESPEWAAALDLTAASRTDPELNAGMTQVVADHAQHLRAQAASLFPDLVDHVEFSMTLDLLLEAMVGMAVSRIADPDPAHCQRLLDQLTQLAHQRLAEAQQKARP